MARIAHYPDPKALERQAAALRRGMERAGVTRRELAAGMGVTPQRVSALISSTSLMRIPAELVLPAVRTLKGRVRPYDLRRDIYPDRSWMPKMKGVH